MTTTIDRKKLKGIDLKLGGHTSPEEGLCLLEAVAWVTGEKHSDHPECVSPVLGAWGRQVNDSIPEARRNELLPFITTMVGTAGDGKDQARAYMVADFAVRVIAPLALDAAKLPDQAKALRDLAPVTDAKTARAAADAADAARAARAAAAAAAAAYAARAAAAAAYAAYAAYAAADAADAAYAADAARAARAAAYVARAAADAAAAAYAAAYVADAVWNAVIEFTPKLIAAEA